MSKPKLITYSVPDFPGSANIPYSVSGPDPLDRTHVKCFDQTISIPTPMLTWFAERLLDIKFNIDHTPDAR